ncbi:MAG: transglutaminase domain-containing protein [Candidatus Neomarinimicrobiota bacterium]
MNIFFHYYRLTAAIICGCAILVLGGCAHFPPDATSTEPARLGAATLSNPRQVEGDLVINFRIDKVYSDTALSAWNIAHGITSQQPPLLRIWSAAIQERPAQGEIVSRLINPAPTTILPDRENGNRILYWELSDSLQPGNTFSIVRRFDYTTWDFAPRIDPVTVADNWARLLDSIRTFYTKPEQFLEQTPEMVAQLRSIIVGEANPWHQAERIFNWVRRHMTYVYPPPLRGAIPAFATGQGDCGQYTALFISMCRIAGIPARQQSGFNFVPDNTGYHVWAEIYLPPYGWVPMDPTRENGFNFIDNQRLIASVGMNIPLKYVPEWSTYESQEAENGRTPFMQLFTMVSSGFDAVITTELKVLKSVDPYGGSEKTRMAGSQIYTNLSESDLPFSIIGNSTEDRPIHLLEIGSGPKTSLIFGGFHGDETAGAQLVFELANTLSESQLPVEYGKVILVPVLNPDGLLADTRINTNGVDINRNFPTENWSPEAHSKDYSPGPAAGSEIETQVVIELIKKYQPDRIITVHSPLKMINYDGPAAEIARIMARFLDYPVSSDIGYPTPGSFGTYTGVERNIPVITLELPRRMQPADWVQNLEALKAAIRYQ